MKTNILILTSTLLLCPGIAGLQAQEEPQTTTEREPSQSEATASQPSLSTEPEAPAEAEIRLNFRNARLEQVLDYLSEAAGFTIVLETQVNGTIDAWSNRPVTVTEAVAILDTALARNGYAAIRNGNRLTIVDKETAARRNIPVIQSRDWQTIPESDAVATYIIPVRYIGAEQLIANLEPLKPEDMQITANADSNSLLITDTQSSIRRIARIAALLDSSVSSVSTMRIIPLQHTDAAQLAETINELYEDNGGNNNNRRRR